MSTSVTKIKNEHWTPKNCLKKKKQPFGLLFVVYKKKANDNKYFTICGTVEWGAFRNARLFMLYNCGFVNWDSSLWNIF